MIQTTFTKAFFTIASSAVFAVCTVVSAQAQNTPAALGSSTLQLPHMIGGGGDAAIVRAIQLGVRYPQQALRDEAQGQSLVSFAVAPNGQVCLVKMEYSIRPDLDTAVVQAVRLLPQMQPALQHGKPVACLMRAPITFAIAPPARLPRKPLPAADSTQLYTAVTRMPMYQGGTGYSQLATDLAAEYLRLGQASGCMLPQFGAQVLLTVSPRGILYNAEVVQGDDAQQDALRARFGDQIAKVESAEEQAADEFPAACLPQLAEAVRHMPRLVPAYVGNQPVAMRLLLTLPNPNRPR
jgi:TonB family protein